MLYLLIIAAGLFAEAFVRARLVVPGDAAATARNLTDHAFLFRPGIAADLSTFVSAVALTIILYVLLNSLSPPGVDTVPADPRAGFIGELSFAVWLAVKGVDLAKWQEKAGGSTASL